jgi:hypothetical protein
MVSLAVVITSIYFQLASRRRKQVLDGYNRDLISLSRKARAAPGFFVLDQCNADLAEFVSRVVSDTERGRISAAEFSLFNFTYNSVEDAIKDRQLQLDAPNVKRRRRTGASDGGEAGNDPTRGTEAMLGRLATARLFSRSGSRLALRLDLRPTGICARRRWPMPSAASGCSKSCGAPRSRTILNPWRRMCVRRARAPV